MFNIGLQTFFKGGPNSGNRGHRGIPGHRGGSSPRGSNIGVSRIGLGPQRFDIEAYSKLSAVSKVSMLVHFINTYKEGYVTKNKQKRAISKLSKKGKEQWIQMNKSVGAMEGMRRAMINRGNATSRVEQRKYYHMAIQFQSNVADIRKRMKELK